MSSVATVVLVMSREIRQRLKSRGFAIFTLLLCAGIIGIGVLNRALTDDSTPSYDYAVLGQFEPVLAAHNRFYPPSGFSRTDDRLVFCEENQVVVYWAYDEDQGWQTDPPIYQG